MAKMHYNHPPGLEKILNFTSLKWLKRVNAERISQKNCGKYLKMLTSNFFPEFSLSQPIFS